MANPLRGEVEWTVNNRPYTLRLSIGDLAALDNMEEGRNGCMALVNRLLTRTYGLNDLTNVLMRALKTGSRITLKREEIHELIDEAGFDGATSAVIEVLNKRLNKEKPEERGDENHADPLLAERNTGDD